MKSTEFSKRILKWFDQYGRHDLPWQKNPTPYRVWISEIMLQQTQVNTVIPYFKNFMRSFPNLKSLALAEQDTVLAHWSGLGYYARARNLHRAAIIIYQENAGRFPKDIESLIALPGIGRSTAGAILSLANNIPAPILDGNVKRVLTRFAAIAGWPGKPAVHNQLWEIAKRYTPNKDCNHYNQAMMDLGATVCTRSKPQCQRCPLNEHCQAHQLGQETAFPERKPKAKERLIKSAYLLILQNTDGAVLLERRAPVGIWGGLWSFPECPIDQDVIQWCKKHHPYKIKVKHEIKEIVHQFSHFQFNIKPLLIESSKANIQIMENKEQVWYKPESHLPGGIAAPVRQLLNNLFTK